MKKSSLGRPVELNYAAMIYSLVARITEHISFIKDMVKRLKHDMIFRLDCVFLVSDEVPSEAAYSRIITTNCESNIIEEVQEILLIQAITEGFIIDDGVAIDILKHETKRYQNKKNLKLNLKIGGKSKAELEANRSIYEKKIEDQLDVPFRKPNYSECFSQK